MTDQAWADIQRILESIREEWSVAEEDIKLAEQICGKVSFPSIKELRYAGRKVVEVIYLIAHRPDVAEIESLLRDIQRDCNRARHDAVDAGSAQMSMEVVLVAKKLGYGNTLKAFPDFAKLHEKLNTLRQKIAESRRNTADRKEVYSGIETSEFPEIVGLYRSFIASQPLIRKLAKEDRRDKALVIGLGAIEIIGLLVAAAEHYSSIVQYIKSL